MNRLDQRVVARAAAGEHDVVRIVMPDDVGDTATDRRHGRRCEVGAGDPILVLGDPGLGLVAGAERAPR